MNKAQKKFIAERASSMFDYKFVDHGELEGHLSYMIYKFAEIDSTPDTKKYVVRLAGGINKPDQTVNGIQYKTKEEAADSIKRFVREHMLNDSYNILSYNGELAEVRYSGYEAGVVYKRWVEEVE